MGGKHWDRLHVGKGSGSSNVLHLSGAKKKKSSGLSFLKHQRPGELYAIMSQKQHVSYELSWAMRPLWMTQLTMHQSRGPAQPKGSEEEGFTKKRTFCPDCLAQFPHRLF